MNNIGNNIKRLRESANMTQETMAENLTVTRQAISNWETGKTQPDIDTLHKISALFETDINELIYGAKQTPKIEYIEKSKTVAKTGISFGACLAMIISYVSWQSVPWAILHGALSWVYVIYYINRAL